MAVRRAIKNAFRLPSMPDMSAKSALYDGRSLHRRVDEEASKEAGYEILEDTNNSSADFYEREQQSLHE